MKLNKKYLFKISTVVLVVISGIVYTTDYSDKWDNEIIIDLSDEQEHVYNDRQDIKEDNLIKADSQDKADSSDKADNPTKAYNQDKADNPTKAYNQDKADKPTKAYNQDKADNPTEAYNQSKTDNQDRTDNQNKTNAQEAKASDKVNINTAGSNELMNLNGIGEVKARSIIEYRTINGDFTSIEDIMKVPGIKHGSYDRIKDYIITGYE